MIDGKTKVCGLIANPVEHTMSPLLQNMFARRAGINLVYVPFKVEETGVKAAVEGAYALNLVGLNVTVPHKQSVIGCLQEIDETAAAIKAVNTLVRIPGGFKGYNTDVTGLFRALTEAAMAIKDRPCILIGAGGAAKAAAYLLAREGAGIVYNLNRSEKRAAELCDYINGIAGRKVMVPMALADYGKLPKETYLAIQTTTVGMHPKAGSAPIEDGSFYENISEAVDVIYTPAKTKFMEYVEAAGGRAVNGLDMLLYQGVGSFELWNPAATVDGETLGEARRLILETLRG